MHWSMHGSLHGVVHGCLAGLSGNDVVGVGKSTTSVPVSPLPNFAAQILRLQFSYITFAA